MFINIIEGFGTEVADACNQIIDQIENYIREGGGEYRDWYVGLADDPIHPVGETLLHHRVQGRMLTYIETTSPHAAQTVANHFVRLLGTDGDPDRKRTDGTCNSLYVYKKAVHLGGGARQLLGARAVGSHREDRVLRVPARAHEKKL